MIRTLLPIVLASSVALAGKPPRRSPEEILQHDQDPLRRETAALVLGMRGGTGAVPLLLKAVSADENKWVRAAAAEALGRLGSPQAIKALRSAAAREKDQRVRRTIAQAQLRLGQTAGAKELMWQLKAGTNHSKAEAMHFLASATGEPLGQDIDAWWSFLDARGNVAFALRPQGSPSLLALRGARPRGSAIHQPPRLFATRVQPWQLLPTVVLQLPPSLAPVTRASLVALERTRGAIPDGCLLLLRTGWREAPPPRAKPGKRGSRPVTPPTPPTPYLDADAARHLLSRAPGLLGVGIDLPAINPAGGTGEQVRELLLAQGRIVLESVGDLDRLLPRATRLLVIARDRQPAAGASGPYAVDLLALIP